MARRHWRRCGAALSVRARRAAVCAGLLTTLLAAGGVADAVGATSGEADGAVDGFALRYTPRSAIVLTGFAGLAVAFALAAAALARERARGRMATTALLRELNDLRARHDRHVTLIASDPQVIVSWPGRDSEPVIEGDAGIAVPGQSARRVLAFGAWLAPSHAQALDAALDALKNGGERFHLGVRALDGRYFEADGRAISGQAVFRLREMTTDRQELARARDSLTAARGDLAALRTMLDAMAQPIWLRDREGALIWANLAYAAAVGAADGAEVVARQVELLDEDARRAVRTRIAEGAIYTGRVTTAAGGTRLSLEIVESPGGSGAAGTASDVTALEEARADLERLREAHARTLDKLPTAVAIFDADKRLVFHNAAYRRLWALDADFLETVPGDGDILERLRGERKLPEQADFRAWKRELFAAYGASAPQDHWWYLPDGRTLRVAITPNPQGGVTYVFDDATERFTLESRYNALMRIQGETLDSLREGVAVFGSDGGLTLSNPAFSELWELDDSLIASRPHVDAIAGHCAARSTDAAVWRDIRMAVAGLHDARTAHTFRVVRKDGATLDCATAPLPDGSTLLTVTDMTASVNVERALTERNEALEKASRIRDDFVHHVSYELRSPLTSAIGFAQLLAEETVGPLNAKQREYADHITRSSESLLALINDILDLASIDNGGVEMNMGDVDVAEAVAGAIRGIEDRLAEKAVRLRVDVPVDIGVFIGDARRVRQVLYNLLSNAVNASPEGGTIVVGAVRGGEDIRISVADDGPGMAPGEAERLFSRAQAATGMRLSVGVGLSLVGSFVELHGGRVEVESVPGQGTRIVCIFPLARAQDKAGEAGEAAA
ncbi:signal transduction histidine kinase [Pseudochelatococcus lubricantis]|uniref:histidine kinase n=1 Tax=Pseudochelatococcus lubricantis TaxID=1538102 RepID=A0ABX0UTG1_9HYPH|nr:PAS domain-containing sensor histidine kinase [Pseudochelatococcus lubricantis]NIJ56253.1 signal transduction histidine kinase [Pseudochelatococcus lubricantis]